MKGNYTRRAARTLFFMALCAAPSASPSALWAQEEAAPAAPAPKTKDVASEKSAAGAAARTTEADFGQLRAAADESAANAERASAASLDRTGAGIGYNSARGTTGSTYMTRRGTTRHLEPFTGFALGLAFTQLRFGLGADLPAGLTDILAPGNSDYKKDGYLIIDFDKFAASQAIKDGADFSFEMLYAKIVQFEISNARGAGFGLSAGGLSGRIDFNLKKEIFDMLADGIKEGEVAYGFAVSGAIFAQSLALNWHSPDFIIPGLFFSITGAHYVPVLYIPRSNMDIKLLNKDRVEMGLDGAVRAYMPFRVFDMLDGNGVGPIDWGGVDVSVQVEYALFPILDLGFTALNIPLVPAALHASSMLVFNPARNAIVSVDNLVQQDFKLNTGALTDFEHVDGTDERWVTRPLRLDVYALFRPFRNDFLVLRPNIGFTTLNPSEDAYFNLGLETSLNCGRWFTFSWFTGGYDGLCRNRLGFDLRLWKIARGYLNVETRSQDYIGAWTVKGVAVEIGAKWGGGFSGLTNF